MRNIYLDTSGKMHSLYNNLINEPPEGYKFINEPTKWDASCKKMFEIRKLYLFSQSLPNTVAPLNLLKAYVEKRKKLPEETDLTYSTGHLIFRNENWVTDLENITQFTGWNIKHLKNYKNLVEKKLNSNNCKKIIPWTEAGKKTILMNLDCSKIMDKIETVHLAVPPKKFKKNFSTDKIKILFVSSANFPNDFDTKGGKEVLEAFTVLCKKYSDLELVMRSYVPSQLYEKYKDFPNIKILNSVIPWEQLETEFQNSDIFLFPSYNTPGLAILDAMSYELPIVTTNVWGNQEMVKDGINGLLVDKSTKLNYYNNTFIPLWGTSEFFSKIKNNVDMKIVEDIVDKTSLLIEDEKTRRKLGRNGRNMIENGIFSINHRNKKLKYIFDNAFE